MNRSQGITGRGRAVGKRLVALSFAALVAGWGAAPAAYAQQQPPPEGLEFESSTPEDGAQLGRAPDSVTIRFNQPLESGRITVSDDCGRQLDDGSTEVTGSEMTVGIIEQPAGHYTASYVAEGAEEGAGRTEGSIGFDVRAGEHCGTPQLESSEPPSASILREAPRSVTIRFSAPLADSSTIEVVDQCERRVDSGTTRVSGNEMEVSLVERPAGHYVATYFAQGDMEGSGSTSGQISFHANNGPDCDGDNDNHNHGNQNGNGNNHNGNHGNQNGNGNNHNDGHDGNGNNHNRGDGDHDDGHNAGGNHGPQNHDPGTDTGAHTPSEHSAATDPDHTVTHSSTDPDGTHRGAGSHEKGGKHGGHSRSHESAAPMIEDPSLTGPADTSVAAPDDGPSSSDAITAIVPAAGALLGALAIALGLGVVGGLFLRTYATS